MSFRVVRNLKTDPELSVSDWPSFVLFLLVPLVLGAVLFQFARRVRRERGKPKWPRILTGNVLVLLFLGSLAFLGMESWYRFIRDTTDSFNYSKTSQRWFRLHYQMNNFGMRDNVKYEFRIAPGKRRVSIIGDSFTVGQGIADVEDRFPNIMRRTAPDLEVHVLAVPGFDTGAELGLLSQLVTNGYQLDIVVLAYCLNDIGDLLPEWQQTLHRINSDQAQLGWLKRNSYFANTMHYRWKAMRDPDILDYFGVVKDAYAGPKWDVQRERLRVMQTLVTSSGGRFGVVTFPFFQALKPDYPWLAVHQQLGAFWEEFVVSHRDLLPIYRRLGAADLTVNQFDAHPNELAHLLAAEAVLKLIEEPVATANPREP